MLSGETFSHARLLFQYMKELSNSDKLKSFIAPNMTDLITFLDNNGKSPVYTGVNIHGIYRYLDMIGAPTTLTTPDHPSRHFGPSSSINNYTESLQPVIAALRTRQKSICKFYGRIGHKADACIIRGPKFLPSNLRRKINHYSTLITGWKHLFCHYTCPLGLVTGCIPSDGTFN